ncbi:MAG TPA: hypothetical protein VFI24_18495 [Pyrinomonadaceae bacterium]|nr:hypothetical protein [Pyrinomonadaceae bacterium]
MATTTIKRFENHSSNPISLLNLEWPISRGHGVVIPPGGRIAVDMAVPWATQGNFGTKHLEIKVNGATRFWIWQANNNDGDFIRFSTDGQWHDLGDHVHGYAGTANNIFEAVGGLFTHSDDPLAQLLLGERAIVVLDSHFECIPISPKPPLPFTFIKQIENKSSGTVKLRNTRWNLEVVVPPGETKSLALGMSVPWAPSQQAFDAERLDLQINGQPRFSIWQHDDFSDGDLVRFSVNGSWSATATRVNGIAETGISPADLVFTGDRTLVVENSKIELWPNPLLLDGLMDFVQGFLRVAQKTGQTQMAPMPSSPKKSAVAFSIPGPSSDAFKAHQPNARFLYNDSGKRYEFKIDPTGKVIATHPDGTTRMLDTTRSYTEKRAGQDVATPAFDLIAANGGRVFAKAVGSDDFYWALMDHHFIHLPPGATDEIDIPSFYFKLDPEFTTANGDGLLTTTDGIDTTHIASERLPIFRHVLKHHLNDMMIARADLRVWQKLDFRPPQNIVFMALRDVIVQLMPIVIAVVGLASGQGLFMILAEAAYLAFFKQLLSQALTQQFSSDPPWWVEKHSPVTYRRDTGEEIKPLVVKYDKVLDIGVGHVHLHQQYMHIVGGEMQAQFIEWLTYVYRFFNGGVWDGDGYVDGTSNYYALVKYTPKPNPKPDDPFRPRFGILFQDEQAYFSQRWRIVGPDDKNGATFSIASDLSRPEYAFDRDRFWDPFWADLIDDNSRMAVSAQVLLVTGKAPNSNSWRIYSINSSWGTMDRSWRWRDFPPGTTVGETDKLVTDENIPASGSNCVYPQTIRLRDDMTLHVKGYGMVGDNQVLGHWYQRYLPADNKPFPVALPQNQIPPVGYPHKWKFLSKDVFRLADNFSHFGVYDQVDSRLRYYNVTPVSQADANTLAEATGPEPWFDDAHQLYISQWKFRWDDPRNPGAEPIKTPSLFNADTRLKIVKRGDRWIAMMWDKRDDDLVEFERLPRTVTLKRVKDGVTKQVQVTLSGHHRLLDPPMVRNAYFWWEPDGKAGIAFDTTSDAAGFMNENVARVRIAVIEPVQGNPTQVTKILDKTTEGVFSSPGRKVYEFRWTPTEAEKTLLRTYCTEDKERRLGVSMWFENIVGNVAPPEQIRWMRSPMITATATPSNIPLGVPTQVTVRIKDARTGTTPSVAGTVKIDGQVVGTTDTPFTFTFNSHVEQVWDAELHQFVPGDTIFPAMTVSVPEYLEADVPLTFYSPQLTVSMQPNIVANGPTSVVTVHAEDSISHAPVAGRVILAGVDVAATDVPFSYAFGVGKTGLVTATGYPNKNIPFGLYIPQMVVSVLTSPIATGRPVSVTVRAIDSRTGAPVNGRVKLNGVDVGATNTPFTFTFGLTPPSGVVSAQFYADVPIGWPPLSVSTLSTSITPFPVPLNKSVQATVRAVDSQTGALIAGRVRINNIDAAATNTPFTTTFRTRKTAEGEIVVPWVSVTAFGYNETEVNIGVG